MGRAPAAACSASRSTAAPGTPPATPRSARNWPPRRWRAARMTCGTPPCPFGSMPPASPPKSPPGRGPASASCMRSTCTAPTAKKPPSASGSKTPSTQPPAPCIRHHTRKRAVIRTVGTTPDPVRYMYANRSPVPCTAHGHQARPARNTARGHPPPIAFPQLRWHLKRSLPRLGDGRSRPTHSPRDTADGPRNRSLSRRKPVTQDHVTGFDLRRCVAGVGFEPT